MSTTRRIYRVKKKKKKRRRLLLLLIPLLIVALGASSYGAFLFTKAQSVFDGSYDPLGGSDKRKEKVNPMADNISLLFIGVDDSEKRGEKNGGKSRSDALMLATFNKKDKSIKLVSIPRDSYVYVPEGGYNTKINHAHAMGGPQATIDTVEELLDIPVDYYVRMNFNAFIDVVDALDGIEVDVPYEIREVDSNDKKRAVHLQPGLQTLDGEEALALARTRKQDSDIQRGERQQEILKAIMTKATTVGAVSKYTDVMEAVGDNMKTNLKFSEMRAFIDYITNDSGLDIESVKLEGSDSRIEGVYYYQLDETSVENAKIELKTHLDVSSKDSEHSGSTALAE
ncbi:LCP family protein [Bacillus sp. V59.32b]|uniref:LCP family protein n=1 Tax=Bacillus sp. V59.32b TaxID=1758642 RepID=UPI000E3DC29A|nr:LCP family protein [Bacillus sp. V59.32b]RFU66852.1 LytR family transcriptional regulator [Bacillus sp. V59.32b]